MADDFHQFQKEITSHAVMAAIVIALVCFGFGMKPVAKGVLLGTVFSVINLILMAISLPMRLHKERRRVLLVCLGSLWVRYALMAVPLVLALKSATYEFFATAAGLFMVQGVLLVRHFSRLIWAKP